MNLVSFKYCDEFHCTGPQCPDHCCKEWNILLGKREYLDYKKAKCSQELKNVIENAFERVRDHEKKGLIYNEKTNYAKIKFNENNECPLHGKDGLCMLQKELGEKALCHTCDVFPRLYGVVGTDTMILGLSITCPHVLELLMNHPEGLEIAEKETDSLSHIIKSGLYGVPGTSKNWEGFSQYWTIKSAQIDIIQNRNFTIPERLLILGFFSKKADEYIEAGQVDKIESLYKMILDNEFCRSVAGSLKTSQTDEEAALKSVHEFVKMYRSVKETWVLTACGEFYEQTAKSIDVNYENTISNSHLGIKFTYSLEKYLRSIGIFRGIEADRGYIFENILVNLIFVTAPHRGLFKSFFELAMFYNILKISLPPFINEDWNDTDLAVAISKSAKMVVNAKMPEMVSQKNLEEHNSFDLPHIAFLIN